jgi:hypothetical protein
MKMAAYHAMMYPSDPAKTQFIAYVFAKNSHHAYFALKKAYPAATIQWIEFGFEPEKGCTIY